MSEYKTYKVTGTYHGKATAKVLAKSFEEAANKFKNGDEDSLEVEHPMSFEYSNRDIVEVGK